MTPLELKEKKISILAHGAGTGNAEELRDWLIGLKVRSVVYITFPFGMSPQKEIVTEIYERGKLVCTKKSLVRFKDPVLLSYFKDLFYSLYYCLRFCRNSDVLVGSDNLLTLAAVWIRKPAKIGKIVYNMIDYTPVRYTNKMVDNLYYAVDCAASYGSDVVWPVNDRTIEGRFKHDKMDPKRVNWYTVPYGNHAARIKLPKKINRDHIVYMGGLLKTKGAELFLPIAEELLRRKKKFKFIIIGGGDYGRELKEEIRRRKWDRYLEVLGYIEDHNRVQSIISRCGVALAPYFPEDKNNYSYYADAGKLKTYLGCGIPIVLTDVPPFGKTLVKKGAGLFAQYDPIDIADKIAKVLSKQGAFRKKAVALGLEYDWDLVLTRAFAKL